MKRTTDHIVLFDGSCNLCAGTVQFIIKRDPRGQFSFASLQSASGKSLLRQHAHAADAPGSVVLLSGGNIFLASDAVLRIFRQFSGPWRFLSFFLIIPRPIRDFFYRLIARYRFRLFGTRAVCMHSLPGWEERFLE